MGIDYIKVKKIKIKKNVWTIHWLSTTSSSTIVWYIYVFINFIVGDVGILGMSIYLLKFFKKITKKERKKRIKKRKNDSSLYSIIYSLFFVVFIVMNVY